MTQGNQGKSRGKWVAAIVVAAGIAAALAEWKFRPPSPPSEPTPATAPVAENP